MLTARPFVRHYLLVAILIGLFFVDVFRNRVPFLGLLSLLRKTGQYVADSYASWRHHVLLTSLESVQRPDAFSKTLHPSFFVNPAFSLFALSPPLRRNASYDSLPRKRWIGPSASIESAHVINLLLYNNLLLSNTSSYRLLQARQLRDFELLAYNTASPQIQSEMWAWVVVRCLALLDEFGVEMLKVRIEQKPDKHQV